MEKKIICFVNLFKANARVYTLNEDDSEQVYIAEVPVDTMTHSLAEIGTVNNINKIILIGAPTYSKELVPDILEYAKVKYNNNDLIVEVME